MVRQRHKRKNHHVVIVTSDATDAGMRQFRIRSWIPRTILLAGCVAVGAVIGYVCFASGVRSEQKDQMAIQAELTAKLEQEKAALEQEKAEMESQIASMYETIQVLSDTVNQKIQNENMLTEQLQKQFMPTEFPLTGSGATMEETTEGDPMCIFTASGNAMVIATAKGTVTAVNNDSTYGHNVWVDHGNGYVTIYRNAGEVKVKQGETVTQGTTLFLMDGESNRLGYQMLKDGVYINPMDVLMISG